MFSNLFVLLSPYFALFLLSDLILLLFVFFLWRKWTVKRWQYQQLQVKYEALEQKGYEQNTQLEVLRTQIQQFESQIHLADKTIEALEQKLENILEHKQKLAVELARLQAEQAQKEQAFNEKLALLDESRERLKQEFSVLANQIFEDKQKSMSEQSKLLIGGMVDPMQKALDSFKQRIERVHKEDLEGRASMVEQLKQLSSMSAKMSDEAKNLTQALKGDAKLQGNWGELILEKLLESSGLREGVEFDREKSFTTEEGKRYRPDVILNLPDSKHIIIDSKVSLVAYEQAMNTASEDQKMSAIKSHLDSLKRHIHALAEKRYDHLTALNSPDFVLMFVPVEGAYLMAIEADPTIFENAFDQRVAVVTPTTLFTTLKTIEQLWRYERQSEHTRALIKRAADVHDKFVGFVTNFEKVGKQLETTRLTYEQTRKQMMSGPGNLVRQAEMLKTLAGKTKKEIPEHLLSEAEGEALESD